MYMRGHFSQDSFPVYESLHDMGISKILLVIQLLSDQLISVSY